MPELPEVETVRRTRAKRVVGRRVARVTVSRRDVVRGDARLLKRTGAVVDVLRHGKQLALALDDGRRVCVHLGMTGSLTTDPRPGHRHVTWTFEDGGVLVFRDPRRFGGVWVYADHAALVAARWSKLGPDALEISGAQLGGALNRKRCAVKAALLDQSVVAGLGNIYVDEALFRCGLWPATPGSELTAEQVKALVQSFRGVLREAIRCRGSTLRDYVDADGERGGFQLKHKVYGRGGEACVTCAAALESFLLAGRTTVACPVCQARR